MPALTFNANNVAPSTGFDAIPAGKYQAVISQSSIKAGGRGDIVGIESKCRHIFFSLFYAYAMTFLLMGDWGRHFLLAQAVGQCKWQK